MKIVKVLFANWPTSLLTIFFMLFSLGQLQRVQLTNQLAFYAHDIVIVCFIVWQLIRNHKIREQLINIPNILNKFIATHRIESFWLAWVLLGIGLGVIGGRVDIKGFLYLSRLLTHLGFIYLIASNRQLAYPPRLGFLIAGSLIGLWGLMQYLFLPDTRFLYLYGWDVHYYRLISTLFDPAFTGMILILTFGWWQEKSVFSKLSINFKKSLQLLLTIAIAATFSRASYLGFAALLGMQFIAKKLKLNFLIPVIFVFAMSIWLLPKPGGEGVNLTRTSTGEARLANSQQALDKLQGTQWLWGRGLFNNDVTQTYETPSHAQLPDSLPILILNATGTGGLLLTILLTWKWVSKWWRQDPLWTCLFIAVLIHSLFNNTLLQPFVLLMLWGGKKYLINKT